MTVKIRVMPTLLFRDMGLVKGVAFDSWRRTGSALQAIKVYNMREVDELVFLDIRATPDGRAPDFAQIDELAGNEPKLIENFKNAPIPIRQVPAGDTEAVIAEFDKIWLPKAPVLAELRKVGATL